MSLINTIRDLKEIDINEVGNVHIGQTEDIDAGTGITVIISEEGMPAGMDVRGGGPASRDSQLLNPLMASRAIHAIVFAGGSAFGLGASNGIMQYLEERDIGYDVGVTKVPLCVQSDIFDLRIGAKDRRPDPEMGYEAARIAMEEPNYRDGNYGAGCGATVGKYGGMATAMKSGVGSYAIQVGDLKVGAIVVVNALGDVFDWKTGEKVAGLLEPDKSAFRSTLEVMSQSTRVIENKFTANTTLGAVLTNAEFEKSQLCKIAGMAHDGYARSIRPVHTTADGDTIYAASVGTLKADQDLVGAIGAEVMSEAILRAVRSAESAYGLTAVKDLEF